MADITAQELRSKLAYNAETGEFQWRQSHKRKSARGCAGAIDAYGYVVIRVNKKLYKAHRLAWLYMTGEWPKNGLDHKNNVKDDNRFANLRDVSQSANMHNVRRAPKSGAVGVVWDKSRQKWRAQIKVGYRNICLGRFECFEQAVSERRAAEQRLVSNDGKG
jgi:hypothetical protein